MAKTTPQEGPSSEILIAGKIYKLDKSGNSLHAVPKGASCSATPRALPEGPAGGNAALPKTRNR